MNRSIRMRPLEAHEASLLLAAPKFNILSPSACTDCGETSEFERQVFRVWGVPKQDRSSDDVQGMIAHHLKKTHNLTYVFFKSYENGFYVDSAVCRRCGSASVAFDIELTDEVLAGCSRLTGQPTEEVRAGIEAFAESILKAREAKSPRRK